MTRFAATAVGLLLVLAAGGLILPRRVEAKTPAWAITGGQLGDSAYSFWADWEHGIDEELPGPDAVQVPAVTAPRGLVYDIYASWGVFAMPNQSWQGPAFRYYTAGHLIEARLDPGTKPEWWRPSEPYVRMLEKAIADGLVLKAEGRLSTSPTVADWLLRGMDKASYSFRPEVSQESDRIFGAGRNVFTVANQRAADFALKGLAETVSRPPAGATAEAAAYHVTVAGADWGGSLGYYSPPIEGHPGRFWAESRSISDPSPYFDATPALDRLLAQAIAEAAQTTVVGKAAPAAAGGAATAAGKAETVTTASARASPWWWIAGAMTLSAGIASGVAFPLLRSRRRDPG